MKCAVPTLSLVDDGTSRPDLAAREEVKFVFPGADLRALRGVLRRTCRPLVYAGPVSTVYSLYYDDPALSCCRANLDGIGLRHKTRVRWYDSSLPQRDLYFETKWRRHRCVGKRRLGLRLDRAPAELDVQGMHAALRAVLPADRQDYLQSDRDAVVLVRYRREHFAHARSGSRLTLDYDIRFQPQLGRRTMSRRLGHRLSGVALIECKTTVGGRAGLVQVLAPLRARPARFSKYVVGCQQLGYASFA